MIPLQQTDGGSEPRSITEEHGPFIHTQTHLLSTLSFVPKKNTNNGNNVSKSNAHKSIGSTMLLNSPREATRNRIYRRREIKTDRINGAPAARSYTRPPDMWEQLSQEHTFRKSQTFDSSSSTDPGTLVKRSEARSHRCARLGQSCLYPS